MDTGGNHVVVAALRGTVQRSLARPGAATVHGRAVAQRSRAAGEVAGTGARQQRAVKRNALHRAADAGFLTTQPPAQRSRRVKNFSNPKSGVSAPAAPFLSRSCRALAKLLPHLPERRGGPTGLRKLCIHL